MKIIITGGTGFIGRYLTQSLLQNQHEITIIGRDPQKIKSVFGSSVTALTWNKLTANDLSNQDIIIHLAGQNIGDKRWSQQVKSAIIDSRTHTTEILAKLCATLTDQPPPRILSASAIGIYGLSGNYTDQPMPVDESWPIPMKKTPDFLSQVGQAWEASWKLATDKNIPVTLMRFGVVLHPKEGMLKKLLPSVKLCLSGKLGNGNQWLSWIHIDDLVRAILFLIEKPHITGPINLTHPIPIQQKHFISTVAHAYHRPCFATLPAWLVKLVFGEMGKELLIGGQQVVPTQLQNEGFKFSIKNIEQAFH